MDNSFVARNNLERERLRALILRLNDEDLSDPIGHGWTVSAVLAHLAYWDQRVLEALEEWEHGSVHKPAGDSDVVNNSLLSKWLAMQPREAAKQAIDAAEVVDHKIDNLSQEIAEAILAAGHLRLLDRSLHRREHLEGIERVVNLVGNDEELT